MTLPTSETDRRLTDEEWAKIQVAMRQYDHVSSFQDLNNKIKLIVGKRRDEPLWSR